MLYGKESLILEEVTSTLLSMRLEKVKSRGADRIGIDGHEKKRKRRRKE